MPTDPSRSYEELAAENAELGAMVEVLQAQVAARWRQLGQNSRNSGSVA